MTVSELIDYIETSNVGYYLFNNKYKIHEVKQTYNKQNWSFYFKKIDDEDYIETNGFEDFSDEESYFTDYVLALNKKDLLDNPHIEFYLERFKKAKRRNIIPSNDDDVIYNAYSLEDIRTAKTIIKRLPNGYSDVAFKLYISELRIHALRKHYGLRKKVNSYDGSEYKRYKNFDKDGNTYKDTYLEPLDDELFNGVVILKGHLKREEELFMHNHSLKNSYLRKVKSALNLRLNPCGTIYTEFVISALIKLAGQKKTAKKNRETRIRSLLIPKQRTELEINNLGKLKNIIDETT